MSEHNRFKDVISAARSQQQPVVQQDAPRPVLPTAPPQASQPAKRGRPANGKRTNPDYEQVAAYIPKELHRRVKIRLLETAEDENFSDLVEWLLTQWMQGAVRKQE
jgi:hypothetical protein